MKSGFDGSVINPHSKAEESLQDLICFGSKEVSRITFENVAASYVCFTSFKALVGTVDIFHNKIRDNGMRIRHAQCDQM